MKKALLVLVTACAPKFVAANASCWPEQTSPDLTDSGDQSIKVLADNVSMQNAERAVFDGNVNIRQANKQVLADKALIDKANQTVIAEGKLEYQDPAVTVKARNLNGDINTNSLKMDGADYQFTNRPGHGSAKLMKVDDGKLSLLDASFTTCPPDQETWLLSAAEINIDNEQNHGEAWGAKLELFDIPVLYLPYMAFPVNSNRKSGFLYPSFTSSSRSGAELSAPFYWNIAPNYDATITPTYLSQRGTQLATELRFLEENHGGTLEFEYLNKDDKLGNDKNRWLARINHQSRFGNGWRTSIDFNQVSDDAYFVDLGSRQGSSESDTQLYKFGDLDYFSDELHFSVKVRDFEVLGDHQEAYRALPYIGLDWKTSPYEHLVYGIDSELAYFNNRDNQLNSASRLHLEPYVLLPYFTPWGNFSAQLSLMHTRYEQKLDNMDSALSEDISRSLPKFRVSGGLNFERNFNWLGEKLTHTLEPQFQYLYIKEKDQTDIGLYDTNLLQDDYFGLFRENRFSGLDRIQGANQITLGVTTRFLDSHQQEKLRFSFGQIFYFDNLEFEEQFSQGRRSTKESALAAELVAQFNNRWGIRNSFQYDTENKVTEKMNTTLDWRFSDRKLVQLTHRYSPNLSGENIRQLGLFTAYPIDENWQFVGSVHRDLELDRSIENYIGLQYESCCWAIRTTIYRKQNPLLDPSDPTQSSRNDFDSGFMVNFVFKGLNGNQPLGISDMLQRGIFGYRRPFYLNN